MHPRWFLQFLVWMRRGYNYVRADSPELTWYRHRTDDVLCVDALDKLRLIAIGTEPKWREWRSNVIFRSVEWLNMGRVHSGFAYNVEEILGRQDEKGSLINVCVDAYKQNKSIELIGHSRGLPLAILIATQLMAHGIPSSSILVVGCGGARIGNKRFNKTYKSMLGNNTFVLNSTRDVVTKLPPWGGSNGKITRVNLGMIHGVEQYIKGIQKP